jgi:translation initiation factor 1 (eIF-1/SUI1)
MGRKETESKGKTVTVVAYGRLAKMGIKKLAESLRLCHNVGIYTNDLPKDGILI